MTAQRKQTDSRRYADLSIQSIQPACGSSDLVGENEASIEIRGNGMTKTEQKQYDAEINERLARKFLADAVAAFAREGADMNANSLTRKAIAKAFKRAADLVMA